MLNTNADTIAGETAKALSGQFDVTLVYCFEKKGVLRDENDDDSVIPQITPEEFKRYVAEGVIQGGMILSWRILLKLWIPGSRKL